jgi:hypothetical protein
MANEEPSAVIGADENSAVPVLTGEYADVSARETAARVRANEINPNATDVDVDDDWTMIILDGILVPKISNGQHVIDRVCHVLVYLNYSVIFILSTRLNNSRTCYAVHIS